MANKCVHKGCGKTFSDADEPCVYHPGPPIFHEGQKGWKCCKPRVLTFDEFLTIPPCTTGKHSTVDDTPAPPPEPAAALSEGPEPPAPKPIPADVNNQETHGMGTGSPLLRQTPTPTPALESETDDPSLEIPAGSTCRRKTCGAKYNAAIPREEEKCIHHPGQPIFHEGAKGWSCCKRRVLEFDEFLKIPGCKTKTGHLYIGKKKDDVEEKVESVRNDFYQTASTVIVSIYLKKIDKAKAKITFKPNMIEFDLPTTDNKRYTDTYELFAPIKSEESSFRILGTKLEVSVTKAEPAGWPVLRSTDPHTGERIQVGRAGRAV